MSDENVNPYPEEPVEPATPEVPAEPPAAPEMPAEAPVAAEEPAPIAPEPEVPAAAAPVPPAPPAPPAPGYAPPAAPAPAYQAAPAAGATDKSKVVAGILGILLGALGIHKFYLGYTKEGIILLAISIISFGMLAWATSIVGLIEGIIYITKSDEDFYNTYVAGQKPWF